MIGRVHAMIVALGAALVVLFGLSGCETLARSQGKFPIAEAFGADAIDASGNPLDRDLIINGTVLENGRLVTKCVPLVRVAFRSPWDGTVVNVKNDAKWNGQSYYMIIDVANVMRDVSLGSGGDQAVFHRRLKKIGVMLLAAADHNGDVYWRHLTTFLETYRSINSAARAAAGAAIAAAFISPVLGASLAGGALVADTFVSDFTSGLNVEEYAAMREATSTFRKKLKGEMFEAIERGSLGSDTIDGVLHQAYDYAFSYSIRGAVYAATKQNTELKHLIVTGESPWRRFFQDEIREYRKQLIRDGKQSGNEAPRVLAEIAQEDAEAAREAEHRASLAIERRNMEIMRTSMEAAEMAARRVEAEHRASLAKERSNVEIERARMEAAEMAARRAEAERALEASRAGSGQRGAPTPR